MPDGDSKTPVSLTGHPRDDRVDNADPFRCEVLWHTFPIKEPLHGSGSDECENFGRVLEHLLQFTEFVRICQKEICITVRKYFVNCLNRGFSRMIRISRILGNLENLHIKPFS